jgi:alginate O-acetyltransferase complex protein AlgI
MLFRVALYGIYFLFCFLLFAKARSRRIRQSLLLIGSYALYISWGSWFVAVLITSTAMNFLLGKWLRRNPSGPVLSIGILLNLMLLGSFKYLPEIAVKIPLSSLERFAHLALPLGISFWTFQAMSYLFDIYRDEAFDPTFFEFSLYMVFFPSVISGPICRMSDMLPQFRSEEPISSNQAGVGLSRIATGALMIQLARLLGQGILPGGGVNGGFDHVRQWSGPDVWCLAFGFGLQLFLDFAGYSHIVIGAAKVLGFTLPENFARPLESKNVSVFWTRWHMSLSFWIRDYLFLPLATARREMWWRSFALLISMVIFGVWHHATVLFALWGLYHGTLLVLHRQLQQLQRRFDWQMDAPIWTPISWIVTISLISFGWIFFRANSLAEAMQMASAALSPASYSAHFIGGSLYLLVTILAAGYMAVSIGSDLLYSTERDQAQTNYRHGLIDLIARTRWYWIPPLYVLIMVFVLLVTLTSGDSASGLMYSAF